MADLTTPERHQLSAADFAIPSKRAYPIPDANHARAALQRVSQFGTEAEKAQVRRAVKRKYPNIDVSK